MRLTGPGGADFTFNTVEWAKPRILPAIKWVDLSHGGKSGSDLGKDHDVYESTVSVYDSLANVHTLQTSLQAYAKKSHLFLMDGGANTDYFFGPEVDYSSPVKVQITGFGKRSQVSDHKMAALDLTFRSCGPVPTLDTEVPYDEPSNTTQINFNADPGMQGDQEWRVSKSFAQDQTPYVVIETLDGRSDSAILRGSFRQNLLETRQILSWVLAERVTNQLRANPFSWIVQGSFDPIPGIAYPFGKVRHDVWAAESRAPYLSVVELDLDRLDINHWRVTLAMQEAMQPIA